MHDVPQPGHAGRPGTRLAVAAGVGSALVLGAAVVAPVVATLAGHEPAAPVDLSAVEERVIEDRRHTEGDVDYPRTPPMGGPHDPVWLDCGEYDVPVREENAVHDLEHGAVWITHDPAMSGADQQLLREQLPDNGIMSPHPDLSAPVVVTVWGAQLHLDGADDPRLPLFLAEYGDGHTAPELGASCHGGTPDPLGGDGRGA